MLLWERGRVTRCATCGAVAGSFYAHTGREVVMLAVSLWQPDSPEPARFCTWQCWGDRAHGILEEGENQ